MGRSVERFRVKAYVGSAGLAEPHPPFAQGGDDRRVTFPGTSARGDPDGARRRRNRTYQATGYAALPVLKTGSPTRELPPQCGRYP
jgi:hypothetical protein